MPKSNKECVARYYENNRSIIAHRKALKRLRSDGFVPRLATVRTHKISITALYCAFADFAAKTGNIHYIAKQKQRLDKLRKALKQTQLIS